jgi:hypothetical protein
MFEHPCEYKEWVSVKCKKGQPQYSHIAEAAKLEDVSVLACYIVAAEDDQNLGHAVGLKPRIGY